MNHLKPMVKGLVTSLLVVFFVSSSFLLTLVENGQPGNLFDKLPSDKLIYLDNLVFENIISGEDVDVTRSPTRTFPSPPADCPPPEGWVPKLITSGETISSLARDFLTTSTALMLANCLEVPTLNAGAILYVPPITPTSTPTSSQTPEERKRSSGSQDNRQCGKPSGWVIYSVQPGDTLYSIGVMTGTSASSLQKANCLGSSTIIRVGQSLFVPRLPVKTPRPSPGTTQAPPTNLPDQPTATKPPVVPSATPAPPTDTDEPPTSTHELPTETPKKPTKPPQHPTDTPVSPTNTPVDSTETKD